MWFNVFFISGYMLFCFTRWCMLLCHMWWCVLLWCVLCDVCYVVECICCCVGFQEEVSPTWPAFCWVETVGPVPWLWLCQLTWRCVWVWLSWLVWGKGRGRGWCLGLCYVVLCGWSCFVAVRGLLLYDSICWGFFKCKMMLFCLMWWCVLLCDGMWFYVFFMSGYMLFCLIWWCALLYHLWWCAIWWCVLCDMWQCLLLCGEIHSMVCRVSTKSLSYLTGALLSRDSRPSSPAVAVVADVAMCVGLAVLACLGEG